MSYDDFTIAWVAISSDDFVLAHAALDEEFNQLEMVPGDDNAYTTGRVGSHSIVIVSPTTRDSVAVAITITNLMRTFPNVRMALTTGIASAVAVGGDTYDDIRLGDIVVGVPLNGAGGVQHLDVITMRQDHEIPRNGAFYRPPQVFSAAARGLVAKATRRGYDFPRLFNEMTMTNYNMSVSFMSPESSTDVLMEPSYLHSGDFPCNDHCDLSLAIQRPNRRDRFSPVVHHGTIGSGSFMIRDAQFRDQLARQHAILCMDTNSGGLVHCLPSIVIRGISDYADTHASSLWQGYAAAMAAAYAKELLLSLPGQRGQKQQTMNAQELGVVPPTGTLDNESRSQWGTDTLIMPHSQTTAHARDDLPLRPRDRDGFTIGIICALPTEADMVLRTFDKDWSEEHRYGKVHGDANAYSTGVIAGYNIVLAHLPGEGNNSAAQAASNMRMSYKGIELVLVVGICGVVPAYTYQNQVRHVVLGDCMISTAVVQFDYGRRGPRGFKRKDGLGRAPIAVRALTAQLQTTTYSTRLMNSLHSHLSALQAEVEYIEYPGTQRDRLYEPDYNHVHPEDDGVCKQCDDDLGICGRDCIDLGCKEDKLVARTKLSGKTTVLPSVHYGVFGSSNTVLKSGTDRNTLAQKDQLFAFEMEGSGVWDIYPTIVVKGACDYADSHKNKDWQLYAAAVAAAGLKALLEELELPEK